MADIKVGDTVRLKSGGPRMTVDSFTASTKARCQWFDGTTLKDGLFGVEGLVKAEPEDQELPLPMG